MSSVKWGNFISFSCLTSQVLKFWKWNPFRPFLFLMNDLFSFQKVLVCMFCVALAGWNLLSSCLSDPLSVRISVLVLCFLSWHTSASFLESPGSCLQSFHFSHVVYSRQSLHSFCLFKNAFLSWAWWCMPLIPPFMRQRQGITDFQDRSSYIVRLCFNRTTYNINIQKKKHVFFFFLRNILIGNEIFFLLL